MIATEKFTSAAVTDRGLNESRPENEDSYLVLNEHGLFLVADGVGGAQAGEVASQMAVEILGEAFINLTEDADPEETMHLAIERANTAINQMARDLPQLKSMASTLVALHISRDIATIGHVGDSRIYRSGPDGRIFRETNDHSVVEEELRAGRLTPEQALIHPNRNVISRALGAEEDVDPDIKMLIVYPGTSFLLCSDGVTRHIADSEIESLLASKSSPSEICERIKTICFERGAEDNLTAVVVKFPPETPEIDEAVEQITVASPRIAENTFNDEAHLADTLEIVVRRTSERAPAKRDDDLLELEYPVSSTITTIDPDESHSVKYEQTFAEPSPQMNVQSEVLEVSRPELHAEDVVRQSDPIVYESPEERGILGSWLPAVVLFVAGSALGALGSYFLAPQPEPPPVITEQKSSNVPLTAFEETRRLVDADPAKFLTANSTTPQDADDFFWLGRALLLTGKPVEAKIQFQQARSRLAQADPANAKTMNAEIAMALAIIDSPQAIQQFGKETSNPAQNSNANVSPAR